MVETRVFFEKPDIKRYQDLIEMVLGKYPSRDFSVRLWDGTVISPDPRFSNNFTLVINTPMALKKMLLHPNSLSLGEAYIKNEIDIEGDIEKAISLKDFLVNADFKFLTKLKMIKLLFGGTKGKTNSFGGSKHPLHHIPESKERTQKAIGFHYDQPIEFWRNILDKNYQYSCAYFIREGEDLNTAQASKLDYICRKLYLRKGETFLDIGCGWGGLVIHAARNYGVRAAGITLSREQQKHANKEIERLGIQSTCKVYYTDFLDDNRLGEFDKIASVGVIEHFDLKKQKDYFNQAWKVLKAGGLFLNHGMSSNEFNPLETGPSFLDFYVFPDADLISIHRTLELAEKTGFEIRDVENLREHYAQTLRLWLKNIEKNQESIRRIAGELTLRVFKLYMSGFAYYFTAGRLFLFQTLLAKPRQGLANLPLTRKDWYADLFPSSVK